jgi:cell division initiation protein
MNKREGNNGNIMSVTPIDIRNAQFNTTMRGYNRDEVDEYLQNVAGTLEHSLQEIAELKESLLAVQEKHDKLSELEDTLKSTLIDAKQTANSILQSAQEDAKRLIAVAQADAEQIEEKTQRRVELMRKQVTDISDVRDDYREKLGDVIASHLNVLQELATIEPDFSGVDLEGELAEEELSEQYSFAEEAEIDSDSTETESEDKAEAPEQAAPEQEVDAQPIVKENQNSENLASETFVREAPEHNSNDDSGGFIPTEPIDQSQLEDESQKVSSEIAQAARDAESRDPELEETNSETNETSENPELYRKLAEEGRHSGEPASATPAAPATPVVPEAPKQRAVPASLSGSDGIVVFGRREDREKAIEENARVLSELDSVVDKFAEQLSGTESK